MLHLTLSRSIKLFSQLGRTVKSRLGGVIEVAMWEASMEIFMYLPSLYFTTALGIKNLRMKEISDIIYVKGRP
jgi:hypothetical protein